MKLIIGIGNPGKKYVKTRHNVGFMVVDGLTRDMGIENWDVSKKGKLQYTWVRLEGEKVELIKPQTFVNNSGFSVAYAYNKHPELNPEDIYVIHDDLDLQLGSYKVQKGKGPKEHKGIKSVNKALGTRDYWRVRVGVDNRKSLPITNHQSPITPRPLGEDYVLQNFTDKELEMLKPVIDKIVIDLINQLTNLPTN